MRRYGEGSTVSTIALIAFVILLVCAAMMLPRFAHAAGYTPIQPAQSGLWFDPSHGSEGFTLVVSDRFVAPTGGYDRDAFVIAYLGAITDLPAWLYAQGRPERGGTNFPLIASPAIFGASGTGPGEPLGSLSLSSLACDRLQAIITIGSQAVTYRLQPLHYESGGGQCYTCASPDFFPVPPGCQY
jgi:hypothetical protein